MLLWEGGGLMVFSFLFLKGGVWMEYDYKEVYFDEYCKICEHKDLDDSENPCCICLSEPMNLHTHKPIKFKEKK